MRHKKDCSDPVTLEEHYERACDLEVYGDSGIARHLPYLRSLVRPDIRIVELGIGGADQSTLAWLSGIPRCLTCYDVNIPGNIRTIYNLANENNVGFMFHQGDTATAPVAPNDLLFVDTLHNCDTVEKELARFVTDTTKTIVFHDVVAFGGVGQFTGADQGINLAIAEFLFTHLEWRVTRFVDYDNGLLTLERG